jgi:hypothetical protein
LLKQAAIKLEAIQRGNHDRETVRQMREDTIAEHAEDTGLSEEEAALRIEAVARGRRDRARVKQMQEERDNATTEATEDDENSDLDNEGLSEEEAAIKIEALARGKKDRERVQLMKQEKERVRLDEEEEERRRQEEEEEEERRQQEEEEEEERARQEQQELEEQERQEQEVSNQKEEESSTQGNDRRKKKKKKTKSRMPGTHKVHPDDVELCEPREIGSKSMLRNLHIGNRKVSWFLHVFFIYIMVEQCTQRFPLFFSIPFFLFVLSPFCVRVLNGTSYPALLLYMFWER